MQQCEEVSVTAARRDGHTKKVEQGSCRRQRRILELDRSMEVAVFVGSGEVRRCWPEVREYKVAADVYH